METPIDLLTSESVRTAIVKLTIRLDQQNALLRESQAEIESMAELLRNMEVALRALPSTLQPSQDVQPKYLIKDSVIHFESERLADGRSGSPEA